MKKHLKLHLQILKYLYEVKDLLRATLVEGSHFANILMQEPFFLRQCKKMLLTLLVLELYIIITNPTWPINNFGRVKRQL